jgi:hypothetical protein
MANSPANNLSALEISQLILGSADAISIVIRTLPAGGMAIFLYTINICYCGGSRAGISSAQSPLSARISLDLPTLLLQEAAAWNRKAFNAALRRSSTPTRFAAASCKTTNPPTVESLEAYQWIFSYHVMQHRSRVVDSPGGNPLVECAVVADAPNTPPKTGPEPVRVVRHNLAPEPGRV